MSAMLCVTFDTLKFVETLISAGMPDKQARALSEAQKVIFAEMLESSLATKTDISEVKSEIKEVSLATKADIKEVSNEIKEVKIELKSELKKEVIRLDTELKYIKWMLSLLIAGMGTMLFKMFM